MEEEAMRMWTRIVREKQSSWVHSIKDVGRDRPKAGLLSTMSLRSKIIVVSDVSFFLLSARFWLVSVVLIRYLQYSMKIISPLEIKIMKFLSP